MSSNKKTRLEQGNTKRTIGKTVASLGMLAIGIIVYVATGGKIKLPGAGA